ENLPRLALLFLIAAQRFSYALRAVAHLGYTLAQPLANAGRGIVDGAIGNRADIDIGQSVVDIADITLVTAVLPGICILHIELDATHRRSPSKFSIIAVALPGPWRAGAYPPNFGLELTSVSR